MMGTPQHIQDTVTLNNGVKMPSFGLGVYQAADGEQVMQLVTTALDCGYRLIDTAAFYQNERGVGQAVRESGIPREEIFVTTKVWNDDQGYEQTLKAFDKSMQLLNLDYIDLYLVHWPVKGKFTETWRALEKLYREGKVRAIGVCNFKVHHLQQLLQEAEVVPAVNQIELHPRLTQEETRQFCREHNIQVEAWAPIMRGRLMDNPVITRIAEKYGKTWAQVILRWDLQHGLVTIPRSHKPERIRQNADVFDFELTAEEMAEIDALNADERVGPDPDVFSN